MLVSGVHSELPLKPLQLPANKMRGVLGSSVPPSRYFFLSVKHMWFLLSFVKRFEIWSAFPFASVSNAYMGQLNLSFQTSAKMCIILSRKGVYLTVLPCARILACLFPSACTFQQCPFPLPFCTNLLIFTFALLFHPLPHPHLCTNCAPSRSPMIQALWRCGPLSPRWKPVGCVGPAEDPRCGQTERRVCPWAQCEERGNA